jgi:hypothetical protein
MSSIVRLAQVELEPLQANALKILSFFIYVMVVSMVLLGFVGDEPVWGVFLLIGIIAMTLIVYFVGSYSKNKSQAPLIPLGIFTYNTPYLDISLGAFVFAYILIGMFQSRNFNLLLIISYTIFLISGIIAKIAFKDSSVGNMVISMLAGLLMGGLYGLIISITNKSYMIFADTAVGTEKCGYTRKRNFKCSVYKNGVLLKNL